MNHCKIFEWACDQIKMIFFQDNLGWYTKDTGATEYLQEKSGKLKNAEY